jgi:excisionase family DNA binding protein
VQDLLKIDRITVYRMLQDGRLTGIKVGAQWRFAPAAITAFLAPPRPARPITPPPAQVLPLACVQLIQDLLADIAGVSAVTVAGTGTPLTTLSRPSRLCRLLQDHPVARAVCQATWQQLATIPPEPGEFVTCPAGLQSCGAPILVNGVPVATLIAGPFYATPPDRAVETARLRALARTYTLDPDALIAAAQAVPVLDARQRTQIGPWVRRVAQTFAALGRERAALLDRLHEIAALTQVEAAS